MLDVILPIITNIPAIIVAVVSISGIVIALSVKKWNKRVINPPSMTEHVEHVTQEATKPQKRSRKTLFAGIGVAILLVVAPLLIYAALQQVRTEKKAAITTTPPAGITTQQVGCDQIDVLQNGSLITTDKLVSNTQASFIAYCYIDGSTSDTLTKIGFTVGMNGQPGTLLEFLAFTASEKNVGSRKYYKATYPNVIIQPGTSYSFSIQGFSLKNGYIGTPYKKSYTSDGAAAVSPIITQQANATCTSLASVPMNGPAPLTVNFTVDGTNITSKTTYLFTFGDGQSQTITKSLPNGVTAKYTYTKSGQYKAKVQIKNSDGSVSNENPLCTSTITVGATSPTLAPTVALEAQPTTGVTAIPTPATLPSAGISFPLVIAISGGLLLVGFGLVILL